MAIVIHRSSNNLQLAQIHVLSYFTSNANHRCQYSQAPRVIQNPQTTSLKRGSGGRSSFNGIVCTVFGNTGFLGRYVCNRLGKIGTQMILPYRGEHYGSMKLKLCGDLGQVLYHPFDLRDEESILKCIKYSNVVINLIGRDWETKNFTFDDVHVHGAKTLAKLCQQSGVERFIHMSCLNANPHPEPILMKGGSKYYKSKWEGELAVREAFPNATIVRPAIIYGQEDRFFNIYARALRRHFRGISLWKKGELTEKQPIWVGDVAAGITALVKDPSTAGKDYQFVGPKRYKLGDLVDWINKFIRRNAEEYGYRRMDLDYTPLFKLKVSFTESISPGYPFGNLHWEGLEKEHTTDTLIKGIPTLEDLGIQPCEMESRIAWELRPMKIEAHYMEALGEFPDPDPPKPVKNTTF
ncbi:hypothetical protein HCN44_000455 [Aphidius gifuensis]|uniref:NADH dehydrogenase [ubiquinone] 1 alpha subcomplex subunit 9, mitochondrial n=1 Tax=Aphidius gifuensis TaxID=684658 RepID=A0A835CRW6_APHGI|nr:NADH dehydrogenase [ubiquinone] 1 alpha subcomplex subunit 9, mitochondrial [Aphidius gifuensis]KAF7990650.1 hypothetical protein HCN44_000455 [Aphidius gifuensis]